MYIILVVRVSVPLDVAKCLHVREWCVVEH